MQLIPVLVPPELIGDAQVPVPAVGGMAKYYLRFAEKAGTEEDALAGTFFVRAEPVGDGSPRQGMRWDGTPHERPPYYPTRLHGDRWGALWAAPRHVEGPLEVHGMLSAEFGALALTDMLITGKVRRLQTVTDTVDSSDPDQQSWRPILERRVLTDVDSVPTWSSMARAGDAADKCEDASAGQWVPYATSNRSHVYSGVLVHLDVDDVP